MSQIAVPARLPRKQIEHLKKAQMSKQFVATRMTSVGPRWIALDYAGFRFHPIMERPLLMMMFGGGRY